MVIFRINQYFFNAGFGWEQLKVGIKFITGRKKSSTLARFLFQSQIRIKEKNTVTARYTDCTERIHIMSEFAFS